MTPDKLVDIVKINFDEQKIENYINAGRLTVHQLLYMLLIDQDS